MAHIVLECVRFARSKSLTQGVYMKYNVCMNKAISHVRRHLIYANRRLAKEMWGAEIEKRQFRALRDLTERFGLSLARGEIQLLNGNWYVTHSGLLRVAYRNRCSGIRVQPIHEYCNSGATRWVFKATVYKSAGSKGFVGYGDADPFNVSPMVRGAEMRIAETRAVNRALRKAYGIGLCSVEELGSFSAPAPPAHPKQAAPVSGNGNGSTHGQPRLRDQLCLLVRQFSLDPTLVKAYAADFCGTETLKEASRDLVGSFISQLAKAAKEDRDGLICKLNSYSQPNEVQR
jgi:hypothetical protein